MTKTITPTPAHVKADIETVMNKPWLINLYDRWQNEREYEDWNEYKLYFEKHSGFKLLSASKRPFSFTFEHPAFPGAIYQIRVTARSVAWRRTA